MRINLSKKATVFIVGAVMALSAVFGIILSPFHSQTRLEASAADHHHILANNQLRRLPHERARVGTAIGVPYTGTIGQFPYFQIVRPGGVEDHVLFENHDATTLAALPNAGLWQHSGRHEYRFFVGTDGTNFIGEPFFVHPVTVYHNDFRFVLPTNPDTHTEILPNVSIPYLPITIPLPSSFYDTRGYNLFEIRRDANMTRYVPHIDRLARLYPASLLPRPPAYATWDDFERLDFYRVAIFQDTEIRFFGVDGQMHGQHQMNQGGFDESDPVDVFTLIDIAENVATPARRTFTPVIDGNNYYAVLSFRQRGTGPRPVATLETPRISVENVGVPHALVTGEGRTPAQRRAEQIRFEFPPLVATTPDALRLNRETVLPAATVSLSRAPVPTDGSDDPAVNPVRFQSGVENFTAFSFIRAERFIGASNGDRENDSNWALARTLDWVSGGTEASRIAAGMYYHRITDFKFIPTQLGEYRFTYFTTTIFGAGYDFSRENEHIVYVNAQGIQVTPGTAGAIRMIRHNPFARFFVTTDNYPPRIMWTESFGYNPDGHAVYLDNAGLNTPNLINFDNTTDLERLLPTRAGAASRVTQILSSEMVIPGATTNTAHILHIPALLGWDNHTASRDLIYTIFITRSEPGSAVGETSVSFTNDPEVDTTLLGGQGAHMPYDNRFPLEINFGATNVYFTNGTAGGPVAGRLDQGASSLLRNNANRETRYTISVSARDAGYGGTTGNVSVRLTYTFDVVPQSRFEMHDERPIFQGGLANASFDGNAIAWRAVNPSDRFTNTNNIEVVYYLSIEGLHGTYGMTFAGPIERSFFPVTDLLVERPGNELAFDVDRDEFNIADLLVQALIANNGSLNVTLIAIARNYLALSNEFEFSHANWVANNDQLPGINVASTRFNMFNINFGSAATISAQDGLTHVDLLPDSDEWEDLLLAANSHVGGLLQQYSDVYLPELLLRYENEPNALRSRIEFEVTLPRNAGPLAPGPDSVFTTNIPAAPNARLGTSALLAHDDPNALFFEATVVGEHILTVTITNDGGNVTVFMATIYVVGEVHYSIEVEGGTTDMHVGQTMTIPSVVIDIYGYEFRSEADGTIVAHGIAESNRVVGSWDFVIRSDNGLPPGNTATGTNEFRPSFAATFTIRFIVTINNNGPQSLQALIGDGLVTLPISSTAPNINAVVPHQVVVTNVDEGDIEISIDTDIYAGLQTWVNANPYLGPSAPQDPRIVVPQFQFPTLVDGVRQITVSDAALQRGLTQHPTHTNYFRHGQIILPTWQVIMANGLPTPSGFTFTPETNYVTVRAPRSEPGEYIVDTRDADTRQDHMITLNGRQHFYFRPIGEIRAGASGAVPSFGDRTVADRREENVFADGIYVVTFRAIFEGVPAEMIFHIELGDTARPLISLTEEAYERLISRLWTHGYGPNSMFTLDTMDIIVDPNGGKSNFTPLYVAQNLQVTIHTPGDGPVPPGNGTQESMRRGEYRVHFGDRSFHDPKIDYNDADGWDLALHGAHEDWGRQIWDFYLTQVGVYEIILTLDSEFGFEGTRTYRINVQQDTPRPPPSPGQIWGIILIVLASGIFLGVVVYFVKTGRQTKFASAADKKIKAEAVEKPDQV